ncbi:MAG: CcoQ/FixQ family Cbb3-type cytochrome c oxidase assembly chaperone [Rickettsiales bacterium]
MNFIYEHAPTTGLIFFFIFFLWVAYRAYRPSAKKHMQEYAAIPLVEENNHE